MGKFTNTHKLSKQQQDELFINFAKALSSLKSSVEAANFIRDLFSQQEVLMLGRRLQIAGLLNDGLTYYQIRQVMKVSENTIAKVKIWLELYGEGYRAVLSRNQNKSLKPTDGAFSWGHVKRKYPMYFWPQLLLEEMVRNASKKERARLLNVVEALREKNKLSKELIKILNG
jgi:TrpR-related protein YerC/YecD